MKRVQEEHYQYQPKSFWE